MRTHSPESSAVCDTWGENEDEEPHLHPQTEGGSSDIDNDENWSDPFSWTGALMQTEADRDLHDQVQTSTNSAPSLKLNTLECSFCNKIFNCKSKLQSHIRMHTGEKPYRCQTCAKTFTSKSNLANHIRIHTGEKPYGCPVCKKAFIRNSSLVVHMRTHRPEPHLHPQTEAESSDDQCDPFSWSGAQMQTEADRDPHDQDQTSTNSSPSLKQNTHQCSFCKKRFMYKSILQSHIRMHTGDKPFSCQICAKTFTSRANLRNHIRIHTGEKPYGCPICEKAFTRNSSLVVHMRTHCLESAAVCETRGEDNEEPHVLPQTEGESADDQRDPFSWSGAQMQTEADRDPHDQDQISTNSESSLKHHRVRAGEKPYTCPICMKHFLNCSDLRRHERIHTGEKPYSCSTCKKAFAQQSHLNVHKRTHTGEKPFSCPMCTRRFIDRYSLKIHIRRHTGEEPFSCSICGKAFSRSYNLAMHMVTHTKKTPCSCTEQD
ncbi:uncharacterized protein [Eucyclogobius newberryi]|uniref:uncharacterized protein isoform X2 n=1 Tax=Eucyclogobius newberryi TaxID=166745 RepID=UPI003B5B2133